MISLATTSSMQAALTAIRAVESEQVRSRLLVTIAPVLPADQFEDALMAIDHVVDGDCHAQALAAIAAHLPEHLVGRLLTLVRRLDEGGRLFAVAPDGTDAVLWQSMILAALCQRLSQLGQVQKALMLVETIAHPDWQAPALGAIVTQLAAMHSVAIAMNVLARMPAGRWQAQALVAIAPVLRESNQFKQALRLADRLPAPADRGAVLQALMPHLPAALMPQMVASLANLQHIDALSSLIPYLPKPLLKPAFLALAAIPNSPQRAQAQASLAARLAQLGYLDAAMAIVDRLPIESDQIYARIQLLPYLPAFRRSSEILRLLAHVQSLPPSDQHDANLLALLPWLAIESPTQAWDLAQGNLTWQVQAVPVVVERWMTHGQVDRALSVLPKLIAESVQMAALQVIVPLLGDREYLKTAFNVIDAWLIAQQQSLLANLAPSLVRLPLMLRQDLSQRLLSSLAAADGSAIAPLLMQLDALVPILSALAGEAAVATAIQLTCTKL